MTGTQQITPARLLGYQRMADKRRGWRCKPLFVPPNINPLVRELFEIFNRDNLLTLNKICEKSGIAADTISQWRYGHAPQLTSFEAVLNAVGYELAIKPMRRNR
jgi:hypothetical protein